VINIITWFRDMECYNMFLYMYIVYTGIMRLSNLDYLQDAVGNQDVHRGH
jgi:hypothetical protein